MKAHLIPVILALSTSLSYGYDKASATQEGANMGNAGKGTANASISDQSGKDNLPKYTQHAPEEQYFKGGMGMVSNDGIQKQQDCKNKTTGTQDELVECDAINFMYSSANKHPKYVIDSEKDPVIVNSNQAKLQAARMTKDGAGAQRCFVQKTETPAKYKTEQCLESQSYTQTSCRKNLVMACTNPSGLSAPYEECKNGIGVPKITVDDGGAGLTARNRELYFYGAFEGAATRNFESEFEIDDIKTVKEFTFTYFYYDNEVTVWLNGTQIAYGQTGSNGTQTPNTDLKYLLHNGVNVLKIKLVNWKGPGRARIKFTTDFKCTCTEQWTDNCSAISNNPQECISSHESCLVPTSTKLFSKVAVTKDCWSYQRNYQCLTDYKVSDCQPLRDRGCEQLSSTCLVKNSKGVCTSYSQSYRCQVGSATKNEETICVDADCVDGTCFPPDKGPDNDKFAEAIAMMEAQREAAVYGGTGDGKLNVFNGNEETCTVKLLGGHNIMSCCKSAPVAPKSTNKESGNTETKAMSNEPEGKTQETPGSTYQYDDLYDDGKTMQQLQSTLTAGWLQCNKEERELGIKRGTNLCEQTRTWCSEKKPLIGCVEESRAFCCFKSILAKLINRQGKQQLGLDLSNCAGFNEEQLKKLDFSKMDFTEFTDSIVPANIDLEKRKKEIEQKLNAQGGDSYYE